MAEQLSTSNYEKHSRKMKEAIIKFNGDEVNPYLTSTHSLNTYSYKLGEKNPKYKAQIANGVQAATDFIGGKQHLKVSPYYISAEWIYKQTTPSPSATQHFMRWGSHIGVGIPTGHTVLSETKADNQAKLQIVRKIRKKQTSFQGGVFVGELARSAALIANPAQALRKGVGSYIRRLRKRGPSARRMTKRQTLSMVRDTWLEYQLGWAPLLSELDDAIKTLAESNILNERKWETVRSIGKDETYVKDYETQVPSASTPYFQVEKGTKSYVHVIYIACVSVGSYVTYNPRRIGFAPTNWAPTIWELIPYSFVVDYFTNIGDIISAATLCRSDIRWMVKTVRKGKEAKLTNWRPKTYTPNAYYAQPITAAIPGKLSVTNSSVTRAPYYGSLVPSLEINLPGSNTQWINVAALWDARRELQKWYR